MERMLFRVGFGTDSHRFESSKVKPLVLGGVCLSHDGGLQANSDGDVILHALFNAISQACGNYSIGYYADELFKKGITDSREYLKIALKMAKEKGYRIGNVGIMVEAKKPYLGQEEVDKIRRSIAELLDIEEDAVGLTFTSGEGLTSFGRGEGILAQSIVSLYRDDM